MTFMRESGDAWYVGITSALAIVSMLFYAPATIVASLFQSPLMEGGEGFTVVWRIMTVVQSLILTGVLLVILRPRKPRPAADLR